MSLFDELIEKVEKGMKGGNAGIPMSMRKISKAVHNIQKGRYDLVAAKTSGGKTAFVDQTYLYDVFAFYMANLHSENPMPLKIDWLYYSLEIAPVNKIAKLAARELKATYDVPASLAELLSMGEHKLSDEKKAMLESLRGYFEELEKGFHVVDALNTPDQIFAHAFAFFQAHGKLTKVNGRHKYVPNHPNHYVFIITDTINLLDRDDHHKDLKAAIDDHSKNMIWLRNVCDASPVVCQQYNAEISNPQRIKLRPEPIVDDLEDSKRPSKDCNTYFSIFDPSEMGMQESPGGYDISVIKNKFRQIKIHKNRDGERDIRFGAEFRGATGEFHELPPKDQMTYMMYMNIQNRELHDRKRAEKSAQDRSKQP